MILRDGLVQLAQTALSRAESVDAAAGLPGLASNSGFTAAHGHHEAVDAAEEAADARDAVFLPVEVAIGRRGKERVHARGIRAVAGDHVVGRDHVALRLRHLRAVLDDHALGEEAVDRLVVA